MVRAARLTPGKSASHQVPVIRYCMDSERITPMAGSPLPGPKPKNVRDDS